MKMSTTTQKRGQFEVVGEDPYEPGSWIVRRPDGLECSGRWLSKDDALLDCQRWNERTETVRRELNHAF